MKSLINTGAYTLRAGESGGTDPSAKTPYGPTKKADCIGVAMWIQGIDRFQEDDFLPDISRWNTRKHGKLPDGPVYGGWMNTNSLLLPNHVFLHVPVNQVLPGDLMLYPSYHDDIDKPHHGHALTVHSVYGTQSTSKIEGEHKLRVPTREAILTFIRAVHCNAKTSPATVLSQARIPNQVKNTWGFVRPIWRYND
jgi:hypothetical protein